MTELCYSYKVKAVWFLFFLNVYGMSVCICLCMLCMSMCGHVCGGQKLVSR